MSIEDGLRGTVAQKQCTQTFRLRYLQRNNYICTSWTPLTPLGECGFMARVMWQGVINLLMYMMAIITVSLKQGYGYCAAM